MKRLVSIIVIASIILIITFASAEIKVSDLTGTWILEKGTDLNGYDLPQVAEAQGVPSDVSFEFTKDGKCIMDLAGEKMTIAYTISGDTILLDGAKGKIDSSGKLIFEMDGMLLHFSKKQSILDQVNSIFGGLFNNSGTINGTSQPAGTPKPTNTPQPSEALEGFELHNGIRFHMTLAEVMNVERSAGIVLTKNTSSTNPNYQVYTGTGTLAGQKDSTIQCVFQNNKLVQCIYLFRDKNQYNSIESALTAKYGREESYYGHVDIGYFRYVFVGPISGLIKESQRKIVFETPSHEKYAVAINHVIQHKGITYEIVYTLLDEFGNDADSSIINDL